MEELKDGVLFSGKYESKTKIYDIPHVIVFANFLPKENALSKDRLKIIDLNDY